MVFKFKSLCFGITVIHMYFFFFKTTKSSGVVYEQKQNKQAKNRMGLNRDILPDLLNIVSFITHQSLWDTFALCQHTK